jgi:hypothetical protein
MGRLVRRVLAEYQTLAEWSSSDRASLEAAATVFRREVDAGYTAVRADRGTNEPVTELPPDAELVILTTAMGGG